MVVDSGDCPVLPPQLALSAKSVPEGPKHRNIALTVAQANVLSLLPAQADEQGQAYDTTRTEQMCGVMRSEGLLFMGIQEARMKKRRVSGATGASSLSRLAATMRADMALSCGSTRTLSL